MVPKARSAHNRHWQRGAPGKNRTCCLLLRREAPHRVARRGIRARRLRGGSRRLTAAYRRALSWGQALGWRGYHRPMRIGDLIPWLAVWGAITGTLALGWQIWARRRAPRPYLKVELGMMADKHLMFGHGGIIDAVLIQVTNLGPLSVKVVGAGFVSQDSAKRRLHFVGYGVELPQEVGPQRGL